MANTTNFEKYPYSTIQCFKLKFVALYLFLLMIASLTLNGFLLRNFIHSKKLRQPVNTFIIALVILNIIGSVTELPISIINNYSCRFILGDFGCLTSGFVMYSIGCISVFLMTCISILRYLVVIKPMIMKDLTYKIILLGVIACVLLGLFWSIMPLIGWSYYSLEENLTTCSVEWKNRSFNVLSYNICMFVFVFFLPLGLIIFTSYQLLKTIKKSRQFLIQKNDDIELRVTKNIIIFIALFMVAWTPYAIISFVSAFIDPSYISPMQTITTALFAKSSLAVNTGFFIYSFKGIKESFTKNLLINEKYPPKILFQKRATQSI